MNPIVADLTPELGEHITYDSLIHCMDLTLLSEHPSSESLTHLNEQANQNQVAAICVAPNDLPHFKVNQGIHLATVVNFPHGKDDVHLVLSAINQAVRYGAQEIDYVVPYSSYILGQKKQAIDHAGEIAAFCQEHGLILKIILETGAFSDHSVLYELCSELLRFKVGFLKTSTGKIPQGASVEAAVTLLSAIKDSGVDCGIKISGGVKTPQQAQTYAYWAERILDKKINNNWFRIGASSLLDELLKGY
jgi:deoxyribose-phosphate aldolase